MVELLVNIAIIGLLISLLLPAVQAAREAARRTACANNFRQVGVAMHGYHVGVGVFPTGVFFWQKFGHGSDADIPPHCARPSLEEDPILDKDYMGWGWGTFLLPYLEEQAIYDRFDFQRGANGGGFLVGANWTAATSPVDEYLCPSDPQGRENVGLQGFVQAGVGQVGPRPFPDEVDGDVARTNMAGAMGFGALNRRNGLPGKEDGVDHFGRDCNSSNAPRSNANGIMFNRSRIDASKVTDGLSKTLIVAEVRGAGDGSYRGYFWVSLDVETADHGINNIVSQLIRPHIYPKLDWQGEPAGGFGSYHPGGCNFLMADGSVHFLKDGIQEKVLGAMSTRAGDETSTTE